MPLLWQRFSFVSLQVPLKSRFTRDCGGLVGRGVVLWMGGFTSKTLHWVVFGFAGSGDSGWGFGVTLIWGGWSGAGAWSIGDESCSGNGFSVVGGFVIGNEDSPKVTPFPLKCGLLSPEIWKCRFGEPGW